MEAVGGVLITAGLVAMAAGVAGLVRGRVGWARITSRKMAAGALVAGFALATVGGGFMPEEKETSLAVQAGQSEDTTTTTSAPDPSTSTEPPATATTEAPTTTTKAPTTTTQAPTTTTAAPTTTTVALKSPCGAPDQAPGFQTAARVGVVPDVMCMDLQLAQDKSQAAGYYNLGSQDQTGQGRNQIVDRDWVVVSQSPAAGTRADSGTRLVFTALAYGDPGAPPIPDRSAPGRMPKLVCFDLQEAQDTLQSAGFTFMTSEDATGAGRSQLLDRNWTVTGQTPAAGGTQPKTTRVVLKAVKDGEPSSCR